MELSEKGLDGSRMKYIAITAMLIDHIAWGFVPINSVLGQFMHIIGRITAPTMCFFIVEGYYHTRDIKRYALRLGIFAIISQLPYYYLQTGKFELSVGPEKFNVIYTLLLSLFAVWAWNKIENRALKITIITVLCLLALLGDWIFIAVLYSLLFAAYRDDVKKRTLWFDVLSIVMVVFSALSSRNPAIQLFQIGVLLFLPLMLLYNGKRGGGTYSKWIFYIFYPAHLLILGLIKYAIIR